MSPLRGSRAPGDAPQRVLRRHAQHAQHDATAPTSSRASPSAASSAGAAAGAAAPSAAFRRSRQGREHVPVRRGMPEVGVAARGSRLWARHDAVQQERRPCMYRLAGNWSHHDTIADYDLPQQQQGPVSVAMTFL
jgi:hypothetical protein